MPRNKKILIIEDEQILGDILLNKLISEGYDASWELNGEEGLRKMREMKPDLVLLDIVMPKKDGYEVLEDMQKDSSITNIPVVVISNSGQPVEIERILALGAKDYIVKAQFSPDEVLEKVRKHIGLESATEKPATTGVKVLIVEDDPFLSSLAAERLKKEGYDVTSAMDGAQALKKLEESVPDLVLLDIIMPGVNGFEVLKAMKADVRLKDVAVIIFSNLGQEQEVEEGKKLGADDFLVKAKFTLKEVVDKINTLLKKKGKM
jgi:DNA-binding response OmpR family regulator